MVYRSFVLAAVSGAAFAQLDKAPLNPPTDDAAQKAGYDQYLPETSYTIENWNTDELPKFCHDEASNHGIDLAQVNAIAITYTDCEQPWVFCLDSENPTTPDEIATRFGKIPVGMRSFVRHLLASRGLGDGAAAYTYSGSGDQVYEFAPDLHTFIHETSHTIDGHILGDGNGAVTENQGWLDAYNADSATFTSYGQTSQAEEFAEGGLYAVYDSNVPGGISQIEPNIDQVSHQLAAYHSFVGDNVIKPGGTCTGRFVDDAVVSKSGSAKFRARAPKAMPEGIKVMPANNGKVIKDIFN